MNAKINLTIVQNTVSLRYYPFEVIDASVLKEVEKIKLELNKSDVAKAHVVLKLFECFLQITENKLTIFDLSNSLFDSIVQSFVNALLSEQFITITLNSRRGYINCFFNILMQLRLRFPKMEFKKLKFSDITDSSNVQKNKYQFKNMLLNDEKVFYWRGWWMENKNGKKCFANLISVYKRFGREFTEKVYKITQDYFYSRDSNWIRLFPEFCHILATSAYTPSQFKDPLITMIFFQELLGYVMTKHFDAGNNIRTIITHWRCDFIPFVRGYLIGTIFAEPYGELPKPKSCTILGHETHIRKTSMGEEIKETLLTDVPLSVNDTEAMEILFYQIEADIKHIVNNALNAAESMVQRYEMRKKLAKQGYVIEAQAQGINRYNSQKADKFNLANICATFEHYGFKLNRRDKKSLRPYYHVPLTEIAYKLALPTSYSLIPFMLLLVAEHPAITASFLDNLILYDKHGKQTGYTKMDKSHVLVGYKKRRGERDAQQIIVLNRRSRWVIEQLIKLTMEARQFLKSKGRDDWRYLFLSCGYGFSYPRRILQVHKAIYEWKQQKKTCSFFQRLLLPSSDMTKRYVEKLVQRLNLSTLRASCGVQIYLETRDTARMAKALGHKRYKAQLLSHYLPEPIQAFFRTRWIRIFQQGIIVEALKDSPYLLASTSFKDINELDQFLNHHALKSIPAHIEDNIKEDKAIRNKGCQEIIFGVNVTILTIFISLIKSVERTTRFITGKAKYWSEIGRYLIKHIEAEQDLYEEAYEYLSIAKEKARHFKLKEIINV